MGAILSACCASNTPTGTIEKKFFVAGPWAVTYTPSMLCCDSKNKAIDVFYPTLLGQNGFSHPVLTWAMAVSGRRTGTGISWSIWPPGVSSWSRPGMR